MNLACTPAPPGIRRQLRPNRLSTNPQVFVNVAPSVAATVWQIYDGCQSVRGGAQRQVAVAPDATWRVGRVTHHRSEVEFNSFCIRADIDGIGSDQEKGFDQPGISSRRRAGRFRLPATNSTLPQPSNYKAAVDNSGLTQGKTSCSASMPAPSPMSSSRSGTASWNPGNSSNWHQMWSRYRR